MIVLRWILSIPQRVIGWIIGSGSGGCNLPLPCSQTVNSNNTAFGITNTGNGRAGNFRIDNGGNNNAAIEARTNGGGSGLAALTSGIGNAVFAAANGSGRAGFFRIDNQGDNQPALHAQTTGSGWAGSFLGFGNNARGVHIWVENPGRPGLEVANGTKSGVVATSDGARALYCEESAEVWFSDYGFGRVHDGQARVEIDPLFAETVNLDEPYHAFLQAYGDAGLHVSERTASGFEVRGRADVEFSYRVVAKRRGYEPLRLERAPWADTDPNLYPERRAELEA